MTTATRYLNLKIPVDYLGNADTVAVYLLRGAQTLDVLGFDIIQGKLTPRFQPPDLIPKGDTHDHPNA